MATVHLIQQGKGGVGKSYVASILYQTLSVFRRNVFAFDLDPINATLAGYKEFDVKRVQILKGDNIDARAFDTVIEDIVSLPEDAHVVIDNGASSFVALNAYIKENDILQLLRENGHKVYLHSIITGGQAIADTAGGLKALAVNFTNDAIVVWLNPFFGSIELDGIGFTEFQVYLDHKEQFNAVIILPAGNPATIGKDIEELCAKRMSFRQGIESSRNIVVRSRLNRYWTHLLHILEQTEFVR